MSRRIATNSMLGSFQLCRRKYLERYVNELAPAQTAHAPAFGQLFHRLITELYLVGNGARLGEIAATWQKEQIDAAEQHATRLNEQYGLNVLSLVFEAEQRINDIAEQAVSLIDWYRSEIYPRDAERWQVLWAEQRFSAPLYDRRGHQHRTWRFEGKWDLVVKDHKTNRVLIIDHKSTSRNPGDFSDIASLDTQPRAYFYAAKYLATRKRPRLALERLKKPGIHKQALVSVAPDGPFWATDLPIPTSFAINVIRRKVPEEPPLLKTKGKDGKPRLSKAKNTDTTAKCYMGAIQRYGLDPRDYRDVLDRLEERGEAAFHYRHEARIGPDEIEEWAGETRNTLEELRRVELNKELAYRASPWTCQNQYGRRCEYYGLCYGDRKIELVNFVTRRKHEELIMPILVPDESSFF